MARIFVSYCNIFVPRSSVARGINADAREAPLNTMLEIVLLVGSSKNGNALPF